MRGEGPLRCPCDGRHMGVAWRYDEPPDGETRFAALDGVPYRRDVMRCAACDHFTSRPPLDPDLLYREAYVDDTYGPDGLRATFDRIMRLPPERSDNRQRVTRVTEFVDARRPSVARSALDVGSGTGVFPAALAEAGWACLALDPDRRAAAHAATIDGVETVCADVMGLEPSASYGVVTLNKVLEHVEDPVGMLAHGARFVAPGGLVYLEVPDGTAASREGPGREEFFVEHLHAFSLASVAMLARRAGLNPVEIRSLREPSGKFTIVAFLEIGSHE